LFWFLVSSHGGWGGVRCLHSRLNDVDTKIHHCSTTGKLFLNAPLVLAHYKTKRSVHLHEGTELLRRDDSH
jgi:hypothetical protein